MQAPALLLKKALELPPNGVLFFIVSKNDMVEYAAGRAGLLRMKQACHNFICLPRATIVQYLCPRSVLAGVVFSHHGLILDGNW
ncbi:MAG: hypothetical protein L0Y71_13340 [Gemmataceae bacterium]|nr:hypothetical protein [Gemmataceae bacterium]